jgi:hypothetical protein
MAKFYSELDDSLQAFIAEQQMFFTATAPQEGRINLSPKGMNTFRCLDRHHVAYLDLTGSGNETAAHLYENGRMTIMFCSFTDKPMILRLYGQGRVVAPKDGVVWDELYAQFEPLPGVRQIIVLEVESAQTSCGYGVPLYDFAGERPTLREWADKKGEAGIQAYWEAKNQTSIDGLPTYVLENR